MRTTRRTVLLGAGAVGAAGLLAACGATSRPSPGREATRPAPGAGPDHRRTQFNVADIPVGGGKIFADQHMRRDPADRGRRSRPSTRPARTRAAPSARSATGVMTVRVPRQPVQDHRRFGGQGSQHRPAADTRTRTAPGHRQRGHVHRRLSCRPRADRSESEVRGDLTGESDLGGGERRILGIGSHAWPARHRASAPPRAPSRRRRGSTGSATRTGRVIYVGKAKSLRQRLNSYFADPWTLHAAHRSRWSPPRPASTGSPSPPRSRRCSSSTPGSRSTTRGSTSATATTSPTRSSPSPSTRSTRGCR